MSGEPYRFEKINRERAANARKGQKEVEVAFAQDPTRPLHVVVTELGYTMGQYQSWRVNTPEFAATMTNIKAKHGIKLHAREKHLVREPFEGDFVARRLHYFGFTTPWFQQKTVKAYERAKPGDIVLVLMPPEHGKTALTEDYLTDRIAMNHESLVTCISEGQDMARKMSRRIQTRLSSNGPAWDLVLDHGPFEPQGGEGGTRQPWGVDAWSIYGSEAFDTRDYTFATGGWNSTIAGTRATDLHLDDIQSLRSLGQTTKMWDRIRQDMLSRPGETGRTTANGTRVGPQDVYEAMDDEFRGEDFYQKIEFPAVIIDQVDQEPKPLWERDEETGIGYTMEMLDRLRKKVGEEAWWRNYMQQPRSNNLTIFSDEGIEKCINSERSYDHRRDQLPPTDNNECWLTLDPSIGGVNVVAAMHPGDSLMLLDLQQDTDLPRNSAIANSIRQVAQRCASRGWNPSMLIIEAMSFQKGLIEDEFIAEVAKEFGMRVESHLTGSNKYDENIGVPSMASSFEAGAIDLAYQSNADRYITDVLVAQCRAWKPTRDSATGQLKFKRGTQLVQDQLMALWFGWIWWTSLKGSPQATIDPAQAFSLRGLPYAPTSSGLLVRT